jgi:hypothetical protein
MEECMDKSIVAQIRELKDMSTGELREKYAALFGEEPRCSNRDWLWKRIAYRIQEMSEGTLSERARRRARELADEAHLRVRVPAPKQAQAERQAPAAKPRRDRRLPGPGTVLVRDFDGKRHEVTILDGGFLYSGKIYRPLSAVARDITGTQWNGYRFFASTLEGNA